MGYRHRCLCLTVCSDSSRVSVCTYWGNVLGRLQGRPVDLSRRGPLGVRGRLEGGAISLEVDACWRKRLFFSIIWKGRIVAPCSRKRRADLKNVHEATSFGLLQETHKSLTKKQSSRHRQTFLCYMSCYIHSHVGNKSMIDTVCKCNVM